MWETAQRDRCPTLGESAPSAAAGYTRPPTTSCAVGCSTPREVAQQIRAPATTLDDLSLILEPTLWWKKRTYSCKLFSNLQRCMYPHAHKKSMEKQTK